MAARAASPSSSSRSCSSNIPLPVSLLVTWMEPTVVPPEPFAFVAQLVGGRGGSAHCGGMVSVNDGLRLARSGEAGARIGAPVRAPRRWIASGELHRRDLLFELFDAQLDVLRRNGLL